MAANRKCWVLKSSHPDHIGATLYWRREETGNDLRGVMPWTPLVEAARKFITPEQATARSEWLRLHLKFPTEVIDVEVPISKLVYLIEAAPGILRLPPRWLKLESSDKLTLAWSLDAYQATHFILFEQAADWVKVLNRDFHVDCSVAEHIFEQ